METPIRVVIADDNADMRRIERMMISRAEGFEIVGEAEDGVQLLTLVEQEKPQLVFLDVEMPGKTGVECARVIQDMNPAIVLIFATRTMNIWATPLRCTLSITCSSPSRRSA